MKPLIGRELDVTPHHEGIISCLRQMSPVVISGVTAADRELLSPVRKSPRWGLFRVTGNDQVMGLMGLIFIQSVRVR